jgi:hypothetical protein
MKKRRTRTHLLPKRESAAPEPLKSASSTPSGTTVQIPLREIAPMELPHVTNMAIRLADLYAQGDRFRLQEIAGQVTLLTYPYIDANNRMMYADGGIEHLPQAVWHLVYRCEPVPPDKGELLAIQQKRRPARQPYLLHILVGRRLVRQATLTDPGELLYMRVGFWRSELPHDGEVEETHSHVASSLIRQEIQEEHALF